MTRFFCSECHSNVYNQFHASFDATSLIARDMPIAQLVHDENYEKYKKAGHVKPHYHIFYAYRTTDVNDELDKYMEYPFGETMESAEEKQPTSDGERPSAPEDQQTA